ncbi:MAG TPA: energy transducer TonB [Woeseiaceae bacterium]|nr:energy transducer TonB [Woeseiaceae bacterium]
MMTRYAYALSTGTAMTFAIFYLMQYLVTLDAPPPDPGRLHHMLGFAPTITERPVVVEQFNNFKQLLEPVLKTPERLPQEKNTPGNSIAVSMQQPIPATSGTTIGNAFSNGPLINIVRVRPVYPVRAAAQELEGYVDVEFDVAPDGSVQNVVVIYASHKLFEQPAINAAKRFRFKARVMDGVPQASYGIRNRFTFQMERS